MVFDSKLTKLLSDFCLDVAKASFVVGFVTPAVAASLFDFLLLLTKSLLVTILFVYFAWKFAKLEEKL